MHDELDFAPGTARIKQGGGIAGHNGLKDISQRLGIARLLAPAPGRRQAARRHRGRRLRAAEALGRGARRDRRGDRERRSRSCRRCLAGDMQAAMQKLHTRNEAGREAKSRREERSCRRKKPREEGTRKPQKPGREARAAQVPVRQEMKCGIVGLPNVGKSTLFNALTKAGIAAENYPFCTIEPNVGIVRGARPAPRRDRRRSRSRRRWCPRWSSSSTSRPGRRRLEGRGPGQQVPRQHPRDRRHRARRALLRGSERGARRRQGRPDFGHRDHQHRARARRPRHGREADLASTRRSRRRPATRMPCAWSRR